MLIRCPPIGRYYFISSHTNTLAGQLIFEISCYDRCTCFFMPLDLYLSREESLEDRECEYFACLCSSVRPYYGSWVVSRGGWEAGREIVMRSGGKAWRVERMNREMRWWSSFLSLTRRRVWLGKWSNDWKSDLFLLSGLLLSIVLGSVILFPHRVHS